jgi:hypothetical protein
MFIAPRVEMNSEPRRGGMCIGSSIIQTMISRCYAHHRPSHTPCQTIINNIYMYIFITICRPYGAGKWWGIFSLPICRPYGAREIGRYVLTTNMSRLRRWELVGRCCFYRSAARISRLRRWGIKCQCTPQTPEGRHIGSNIGQKGIEPRKGDILLATLPKTSVEPR